MNYRQKKEKFFKKNQFSEYRNLFLVLLVLGFFLGCYVWNVMDCVQMKERGGMNMYDAYGECTWILNQGD